jgi:phosphopantetheine--protein transferase-like protein
MVVLCGIDLVLNERINKQLESAEFLTKVFNTSELFNKSKLPGIFALKEAAMKSIGKKIDWKEVEITFNENGKPKIDFSSEVLDELKLKLKSSDCSISHDGDYTVGMVVLEV